MRLEGNIAQFLLAREIRERIKPYLEPWMFETIVYKAMSMSLLDDMFDDDYVDTKVLLMQIKNTYSKVTKEDISEVNRLIEEFDGVQEKDIVFVLNIIEDFIKKKMYTKGMQLMVEDNLSQAEEWLHLAATLSLKQREYTNLGNAKKLSTLLEHRFPKDGKYIKSSFGLINENSTFKGYRRGDLVQIVAPPGVGKSTLLCQEAAVLAHQGFKVGFAIIGDNEEDDIATKVCSYYSKMPVHEVIDDLESYITEYKQHIQNINCIPYPAGTCSVREVLSDFTNIKKREGLDILIIDYDANLSQAHESMYESGGIIYKALKAYAQIEQCVVLVASQPKTNYWNSEIIPLEGANESSKKQHAVDMMITLNKNSDCNKIGTLFLAKIRRGVTGVASKIRLTYNISKLEEISRAEYDIILEESKKQITSSRTEELTLLDEDHTFK